MLKQPCTCILCSLVIKEVQLQAEPPPGSEFLSFFSLYSRILADFLCHMGKWVRLIIFDAEYEYFHTCVILWFFNLPSVKMLIVSFKFDQAEPFIQITHKVCQSLLYKLEKLRNSEPGGGSGQ